MARGLTVLFIALLLVSNSDAGITVAIGLCYAGCAAVTVACFAAAGFTFGTVPGAIIVATPALATCNAAFAACESACVAATIVVVAKNSNCCCCIS